MADNVIPQYFRREQLETSGLPRAPAGQIADVGARLAPDAMTRFGGALSGIALDRLNRMIDAQAQSQYTEGKAKWEEAETKFLSALERDPDFEGYDKKYKAHIKETSEKILTKDLTSDAKEILIGYIENQKAALGKNVAATYIRKQKDYARASTYEAVRKFEMAGNVPAAKAALIEGREAGYLGAEETAKRIAQVEDNATIYQRQKVINSAHEAAKLMPFKEAIGYLNDLKGVTTPERNDLIARRKRQNEIETATRDSETYWKLLRRVMNDPKSVTEPEVAVAVKPNSITTDDYKEIMGIKDAVDDPLKTPRAQLYFNSLNALFAERETDAEERLNYDIANEKLMQFFKDNPKVSAKQAAEFYDELISPEVEGILDRVWNVFRFVSPLGATVEAGLKVKELLKAKEGGLSEPKTLEEFNITVSGIEDEEEAKAYYEKWKYKW